MNNSGIKFSFNTKIKDTHMATLLETINLTREQTISTHYDAALTELKDKVKTSPLQTSFKIESGCVSKDIASEISFRFNAGGIKSSVATGGLLSTTYHLTVEVSLPQTLVHPEEKKVEVQEEKKVEVQEEKKVEIQEEKKETL